jgi:hypothetical protein
MATPTTLRGFFWLLVIIVLGGKVQAQQFQAKTELQSTFIDITGLFGVDEPASVTQFSFLHKGFGLDLYHGFSLVQFGKTIQSIVTPSYSFKLDGSGKFFVKPKVEIANIETTGGGFVRPGIHVIYKPKKNQVLNVGSWTFHDLRDQELYPKRLNGFTVAASYQVIADLGKWKWTNEIRFLYVDVKQTLKTAGALAITQVTYKPLNLYAGGSAFQSAYRSDGQLIFNWNVVIGKSF